jgi:glutaredoxin-like protein NrdH
MTITVYSRPANLCRNCWSTEKRMDARNISYTKVMVDDDDAAKEVVAKLGYTQAPVVVVERDGKIVDHWSGFKETKIAQLASQAVA